MPVFDCTNPEIVKFLSEDFEKTVRLRMKWNKLHSQKLKEAATLHRKETGYTPSDVFRANMVGGMATLARGHVIASHYRKRIIPRDCTRIPRVADMKKGHSIVDVGLGDPKEDPRLSRPDADFTPDPVMRIVDPKHKDIIYKNLPTFGRAVYLKHRSKIVPEQKYYFRECSGWDYGWRIKDSYFSINRPKYGRVLRLTRDEKSRRLPHDPAYYNNSDIFEVTKCPI